jgi:hypothetical protein
MTEGKKEGPNDTHGGPQKGWIGRGVEQKSQCAAYTHTAYVGWHTGGAGPTSLCSEMDTKVSLHDGDGDNNSSSGIEEAAEASGQTTDDNEGSIQSNKDSKQARSRTKKPVCRIYAHGVRRVAHRAPPPGPTSLCSVAKDHG